jgi:hypothetical protein
VVALHQLLNIWLLQVAAQALVMVVAVVVAVVY